MKLKRIFLNIGLLLLFVTAFDAGLICSGLSARYTGSPSFTDGSLSEILILGVISIVITTICSGAFKGYKTEFLIPYKQSVTITVIVQVLTVVFSFLWLFHSNSIDRNGDMMPGLSSLGDYVSLWFIWILVLVALTILWIVTAIKHRNRV